MLLLVVRLQISKSSTGKCCMPENEYKQLRGAVGGTGKAVEKYCSVWAGAQPGCVAVTANECNQECPLSRSASRRDLLQPGKTGLLVNLPMEKLGLLVRLGCQ